MNQKPHISEALCHLRFGITGAALVIGMCAVVQLLVFAFVHFTDVRWMEVEETPDQQQLSVVAADSEADQVVEGKKTLQEKQAAEHQVAQTTRVHTKWHFALLHFNTVASTGGVIAGITFGLLLMLGVVVAGGASVPGIEKVVSSCTWGLALGLMCVPWADTLTTMQFPGLFAGYEHLLELSAAAQAGTGSSAVLYATFFALPVFAIVSVVMITLRFRAGVELGIMVTNVSELDEMLDREMTTVAGKGVGLTGSPRTIGALNRAVGEQPVHAGAEAGRGENEPVPQKPAPAKKTKVAKKGRAWVSENDRRVGDPSPGDPLKRPI